ncbi:hypothetical protein RLOC_00012537 [Lonchura striata]|uniref:Uncharacterized protein n=1 Tax=Lonchura striata TaxID=40157 RepID=A0A218V7X6_9PASE|nr:hypothetical protein RLOC_00012537 [Lonchura striata domestica]
MEQSSALAALDPWVCGAVGVQPSRRHCAWGPEDHEIFQARQPCWCCTAPSLFLYCLYSLPFKSSQPHALLKINSLFWKSERVIWCSLEMEEAMGTK